MITENAIASLDSLERVIGHLVRLQGCGHTYGGAEIQKETLALVQEHRDLRLVVLEAARARLT